MPTKIDAKTDQESSTDQDVTTQTAEKSSTSADVTTQEQSRETAPSLAEVARKAYEASTAKEGAVQEEEEGLVPEKDKTAEEDKGPGEEDEPDEEETQEGQEQKTEQEQEGEEEDEESAKTDKTAVELSEQDKKLPFHKHPRFVELTKQSKEAGAKVAKLENFVRHIEPDVKFAQMHNQFVQQHAIEPSAVNDVMNALARINTDPVKARELLKPYWDQVQGVDSQSLPSDLAARVAKEELTEAAALEIAQLRGNKELESRRQRHQQNLNSRNQQMAVDNTINNWDAKKMETDPSYKPKVGETGPDGLREVTHANFIYLQSTRPPGSLQDIVRNLEDAYSKAVALLKPRAVNGKSKNGPIKPVLTSKQSSQPPLKKPENLREIAAAVGRKHGIRVGADFYSRD